MLRDAVRRLEPERERDARRCTPARCRTSPSSRARRSSTCCRTSRSRARRSRTAPRCPADPCGTSREARCRQRTPAQPPPSARGSPARCDAIMVARISRWSSGRPGATFPADAHTPGAARRRRRARGARVGAARERDRPGEQVPVRPAPARHRHRRGTRGRPRSSGSRGRSTSGPRSTSRPSPSIVTPTSDTLHETPFLYLAGERAFDLPGAAGIEALRRFLTFGGFLLIDSAEGSTDGAFDASVRKLITAVFPPPDKGLEIIAGRSRRLQVVLPARQAGRPARDRAGDGGRRSATTAWSARTSRTTSAARGRATTSATTTIRASRAARSSASSRSAWA